METHQGEHIYYDNNFMHVQAFLGYRPGREDKVIDPYYLKKGFGMKPMFYDTYKDKWELIHPGDRFYINEEGVAVRESVRDV